MSVSHLSVALRFDATICKYLRHTSAEYGQVNKIYSPGKLPEPDAIEKCHTPRTLFQTPVHEDNRFYVAFRNGNGSVESVQVLPRQEDVARQMVSMQARLTSPVTPDTPLARDIVASEVISVAMADEARVLSGNLERGVVTGAGSIALPLVLSSI